MEKTTNIVYKSYENGNSFIKNGDKNKISKLTMILVPPVHSLNNW